MEQPQAHFVRRGRANKPVVSPERTNGRGRKGGQLADQIFGWGCPPGRPRSGRGSPQESSDRALTKKRSYLGIECKT